MTYNRPVWTVIVALGSLLSAGEEDAKPDKKAAPNPIRTIADLPYAGTDNPRQQLDLYLSEKPASDKPLPVVVIIHGNFQNADKKSGLGFAQAMVTGGKFAAVSIGYRLSDEAQWPAQIHDCKAAIRWVRGNAKKYNLDPERIGVIGPSAGGHLAAVLGTSDKVPELEGTLGEYRDMSSRVACVVDLFGPTNLLTLGVRHDRPNSPESKLLGGPIQEKKELARQASAITHVTADDPPFLLIHGTKDPNIPFVQSEMFVAALKKVKVEAWLVPVEGGVHGNFRSPEVPQRFYVFFDKYLRDADVKISTEPIVPGKDNNNKDNKPGG